MEGCRWLRVAEAGGGGGGGQLSLCASSERVGGASGGARSCDGGSFLWLVSSKLMEARSSLLGVTLSGPLTTLSSLAAFTNVSLSVWTQTVRKDLRHSSPVDTAASFWLPRRGSCERLACSNARVASSRATLSSFSSFSLDTSTWWSS